MMNEYLIYNEKTITDFSAENINSQYNQGYIFGRRHRGDMYQTRSLRLDLSQLELSSENRRVLRLNADLDFKITQLPYPNYSWEIHKLGKDFYTTRFGDGTMSAHKIKEMFTEPSKNNMNSVFEFAIADKKIGYCLVYDNSEILHYAYPFYELELQQKTIGIGMMTKAIEWAKQNNYHYIYLGTVASPESKYKLQFKGLQWWNQENAQWDEDLTRLKGLLN